MNTCIGTSTSTCTISNIVIALLIVLLLVIVLITTTGTSEWYVGMCGLLYVSYENLYLSMIQASHHTGSWCLASTNTITSECTNTSTNTSTSACYDGYEY